MISVLGLIPARGGSRRLPQKNTRLLAGRPMIAWTVDVANKSQEFSKVVVSTDNKEIAEAAFEAGADVPFMRPSHLADDSASSIDVALHALERIGPFDILVLLQPTSPLRQSDEITRCIQSVKMGAPAAVSVRSLTKPWSVYQQADELGRLNPCPEPVVIPNVLLTGAVYAIQASVLLAERTFLPEGTIGVNVPEDRSIDVDYVEEFDLCESVLRTRLAK